MWYHLGKSIESRSNSCLPHSKFAAEESPGGLNLTFYRRHAVCLCLCLWWSVKAGYAEN